MMLTESDLRDVLREACQAAGSQMAWADRHGLSRSYVSDLLNGHRPFSDRALTAIGCERRYVRVGEQPGYTRDNPGHHASLNQQASQADAPGGGSEQPDDWLTRSMRQSAKEVESWKPWMRTAMGVPGREAQQPVDCRRDFNDRLAIQPDVAQATLDNFKAVEEANRIDAVARMRKALHCLYLAVSEPSIVEDVTAKFNAVLVALQVPRAPERESVELIPADQWSELDGAVLWWYFPIAEPPYCGTPLDSDWPTLSGESFYTHFTRIPLPQPPLQSRKSPDVKA